MVQLGAEFVVGEDGEVGGDEVEVGAGLEVVAQEVAHGPARMVVPDARMWGAGHAAG